MGPGPIALSEHNPAKPNNALHKKTLAVVANRVVQAKLIIPCKILVADMGNQIPKIVKYEKVTTLMAHGARNIATRSSAAAVLGTTSKVSQKFQSHNPTSEPWRSFP